MNFIQNELLSEKNCACVRERKEKKKTKAKENLPWFEAMLSVWMGLFQAFLWLNPANHR